MRFPPADLNTPVSNEPAPPRRSILAGATPTHRPHAAGGSPGCAPVSPDWHRRCTASKALYSSTRPLDGARSGCNAWRQRQEAPGERAAINAVISAEIEAVFGEHRGFYGSPPIHQELHAAGRHVGLHRVARLMRLNALRVKTRKVSGPAPKPAARPVGWWTTCCSRTSIPQPRTSTGQVTSPTSAPALVGGT